ncbi:MAG: MerR family transcriptional regulator [Candidatus Omnitrophica bacterium]|jgi:DNA-binding transcriptional MerR regulator|nr:MerR family transcriptional regulator [Candidatus Omnitrophota bacterium]
MKVEKLYKIGEVMQFSGLSRQTIHNYTLTGLIREAKRTPSGHRLYDETVFERLEKIKILQSKHYTLMQIKKILEKEA